MILFGIKSYTFINPKIFLKKWWQKYVKEKSGLNWKRRTPDPSHFKLVHRIPTSCIKIAYQLFKLNWGSISMFGYVPIPMENQKLNASRNSVNRIYIPRNILYHQEYMCMMKMKMKMCFKKDWSLAQYSSRLFFARLCCTFSSLRARFFSTFRSIKALFTKFQTNWPPQQFLHEEHWIYKTIPFWMLQGKEASNMAKFSRHGFFIQAIIIATMESSLLFIIIQVQVNHAFA